MCVNEVRTVISLSRVGLWLWSVLLERYEGSGGGAPQQQVLGWLVRTDLHGRFAVAKAVSAMSVVSLGLQTWAGFFRPFPNGREGLVPSSLLRKKKAEMDSSPKPIYHTNPLSV